jgi:hypothetical protein
MLIMLYCSILLHRVNFLFTVLSVLRATWAVPSLRRLIAGFPPRRLVFDPMSCRTGFVADKVGPGQDFSEYFCFPCQFSFHRLLHTYHLSSRAGTIGQILADVPSGLSLTSPQEIKKNYMQLKSRFKILS